MYTKITKFLAKFVKEIGTGLKIDGDSTVEHRFLRLREILRVLMHPEYFEIPSPKPHMKKHTEWTYGIALKIKVNLRYLVPEKIRYVKFVTRIFWVCKRLVSINKYHMKIINISDYCDWKSLTDIQLELHTFEIYILILWLKVVKNQIFYY